MEDWQRNIIIIYTLFSLAGLIKALWEIVKKNNPFGSAGIYVLTGSFVWGDLIVFGLFWVVAALTVLFLNDWILFLLAISVFWLIRSIGETIYWLNQQFSKRKLNPPERFWLSKYFPNESIWFIFQIFWQSLSVVFALLTIYYAKIWIVL